MKKTKTNWQRTGVQNLLRDGPEGTYYARFTISGKQKWFCLETKKLRVAKLRLADKSKQVDALRGTNRSVASGDATMFDLFETYIARTKANSDIKPGTVTARLLAVKRIRKTWPGIDGLEPSEISTTDVYDWATKFKLNGTGFRPPGAKKARVGNSATSVNSAIDALRHTLDIAIEQGQISTNPVAVKRSGAGGSRLKKKISKKALILPSKADVEKLFSAMENNGSVGGGGAEAADFCRFLLRTGARVGEGAKTVWEFVDWDKNTIFLPGYKSETSPRHIPLFTRLAELLKKVQERRRSAARYHPEGKEFLGAQDPIYRIKECQRTIDAACARIGIKRITHHDFRHLFATGCIEAGVDIQTVSRWLGHNDGGALAMKTYGHLRPEHSQAAAAKVNF